MLLDDMGDLLSTGGLGTVGSTIFLGYEPPAPDAVVVVYETAGLAPERAMSPLAGTVVCERPGVQIVCRGVRDDYATPRQQAHLAWKLIEGLQPRTLNGRRYLYAEAIQSPFPMRRDDVGRVLIGFNAVAWKELATSS